MLVEEEDKEKATVSGPDFAAISFLTSIYVLFIVLSFREYFFFIPTFTRPHPVIAYVQVLTAIGWVLLILLPPLALLKRSSWSRGASWLILISALVWPISTLIIKVLNFFFYGNPFVGYLGDHPLFLLMEYGIPALYLYIWKRKRSQM
jgi:hypothetical protein